jgi:hypothetical protein
MNPEQDDFKRLRQLLLLKRHEQPPPGYFNDFSRQVIDQLVAGRQLEQSSAIERLSWEAPWLQRLWTALETKPALAGAFGVAVCSLLISGVVYSEKTGSGSFANLPPIPEAATTPVVVADVSPAGRSLLDQPSRVNASSTEGFSAMPARLSLFQEIKDSPKPWGVAPAAYPVSAERLGP